METRRRYGSPFQNLIDHDFLMKMRHRSHNQKSGSNWHRIQLRTVIHYDLVNHNDDPDRSRQLSDDQDQFLVNRYQKHGGVVLRNKKRNKELEPTRK